MDYARVLLPGFNLNYFSFYDYSVLHCIFLKIFHQKINKPNIHNNINGGISRFQNELNELPSRTGYYFNSQSYEGSHEGKFFLLIFEHFSQNAYF